MAQIPGVDMSNLNGPPDQYSSLQAYIDAQFAIFQAIPRPRPSGLVAVQLQAAREDGKYKGIYSWLWHDPNWRLSADVAEDQRLRLATVPDDEEIHMRPWLDVEDNQSDGWRAVSIQQRVDDVNRALEVLDAWAFRRGLPEAGIYWSDYFIGLLFGGHNYWPDRKQWKAHYMDSRGQPAPGSLIGGNVVAHQYTSDPIDQNMMLESEILSLSGGGDVPDPNVDYGWQQKKDQVVQAAGELLAVSDQLLAEANRKGGPRVREIRRLANPEVRARAERILA